MPTYQVQIIGPDGEEVAEERLVPAGNPDEAATLAIGGRLIRGAKGSRNLLRAKVYWKNSGTTTMARFYQDPASTSD
jgi:hypothetical protein